MCRRISVSWLWTCTLMWGWLIGSQTTIQDIHDGLNTLSFTIVIVSSEQGEDKKQMFLECRWYNIRLDRTINIAKGGIKVLRYLYSWEILDRIVPHRRVETKQPVDEHTINTYWNTNRLLIRPPNWTNNIPVKSNIWMIRPLLYFLLEFEWLLTK